jgi:hypothetical protein
MIGLPSRSAATGSMTQTAASVTEASVCRIARGGQDSLRTVSSVRPGGLPHGPLDADLFAKWPSGFGVRCLLRSVPAAGA